jgi:hypothetical protein
MLLMSTLAMAACHHAAPPPAPPPAPTPPADSTAAAAPPAPATPAPDTTARGWTAGNLTVGNGVVVVRARYGGRVYVGAGTATNTIALTFAADDVDQFVTDARALLPPKPAKDQPTPVLSEPGSNRAMSFSRAGRGVKATYHFYFADENLHGFPLPATVTEAKGVLNALARGAAIAREATPKSD